MKKTIKSLLTVVAFVTVLIGLSGKANALCSYGGTVWWAGHCIPHPSDENKFFKCSGLEQWVEQSCPPGAVFIYAYQLCSFPI